MKGSSGGGVGNSTRGAGAVMGIAGLLVPPVAALWLWQAAHLLPVSFQDLGAVVVMLWIVLAGNGFTGVPEQSARLLLHSSEPSKRLRLNGVGRPNTARRRAAMGASRTEARGWKT